MDQIAVRYLRFADFEASGRSLLYEGFARHVAASPEILRFLSAFPIDKQQPNLLFAATRLVAGTLQSGAELEAAITHHASAIGDAMMMRSTQTNEPARCGSLMPTLASLEGPLALIEIGASAGLCLLPDFYGYDWDRGQLKAPPTFRKIAPEFNCHAAENVPLPTQHLDVVWRAGLDLNPLDIANEEDVRWLEHLVWPEHVGRLEQLRRAICVAKQVTPLVIAGDLRQDIYELIAQAPKEVTVVVYHSAVLSYLSSQHDRDEFARSMGNANVVWICNESPQVFPDLASRAGPVRKNMFLLSINSEPIAWCGPHGQEISFISS